MLSHFLRVDCQLKFAVPSRWTKISKANFSKADISWATYAERICHLLLCTWKSDWGSRSGMLLKYKVILDLFIVLCWIWTHRRFVLLFFFLIYRHHHHHHRNLEVVSDVTYNQLSDSVLVLFAVQCCVVWRFPILSSASSLVLTCKKQFFDAAAILAPVSCKRHTHKSL